jgi:uncharacterized protein YidB (DUF937 family)
MSGFFSQLASNLLGNPAVTSAVTAALPGIMTQLLGAAEGATGGGLGGILAQLENAGLGAQVKSWLGPDSNLPITAEHILAAIPPEQLNAMADKVGLPHDQMAAILAHVLPHAVDHVTPDGQVPPAGAPAASIDYAALIGAVLKSRA